MEAENLNQEPTDNSDLGAVSGSFPIEKETEDEKYYYYTQNFLDADTGNLIPVRRKRLK